MFYIVDKNFRLLVVPIGLEPFAGRALVIANIDIR